MRNADSRLPTHAVLLRRIDRYLRSTGTSPTAFGRAAANDPRLVFDMRLGREPRMKLERKLHAYLDRCQREKRQCRR